MSASTNLLAILIAVMMLFSSTNVGVIGGADGPTTIYLEESEYDSENLSEIGEDELLEDEMIASQNSGKTESLLAENEVIAESVSNVVTALAKNFDPMSGTMPASLKLDQISASDITYEMYADDAYAAEEVLALQPGDVIFVYGQECLVEKMDVTEYGVEINGGYYEAENGVTLMYIGDDTTVLYPFIYEHIYKTNMGEITLPLAEKVKISYYTFEETGDLAEDLTVVECPAQEVRGVLTQLHENEICWIEAFEDSTSVVVDNGVVTEIVVQYAG